MVNIQDGPATTRFRPIPLAGGVALADLPAAGLSEPMAAALAQMPWGECVAWGLPFAVERPIVLADRPVVLPLEPFRAGWLVFMHTSDIRPVEPGPGGFVSPMRGQGQLGELAAEYVIVYADGTEAILPIRRRHQIGMFTRRWGENCFEAVPHRKPQPIRPPHEQPGPNWGRAQFRATAADGGPWVNWLWAWQNPEPAKPIAGLRLIPRAGRIVLAGLAAGDASALPLRWRTRQKALVTLPAGEAFQPDLDAFGLLAQIQLDMGQVISASPRLVYPNDGWAGSYNNQVPEVSTTQVAIEYTAHPDASFHLVGGGVVPVAEVKGLARSVPQGCCAKTGQSKEVREVESTQPGLEALAGFSGHREQPAEAASPEETGQSAAAVTPVAAATQRVTLRVVPKGGGAAVPVKLHVHGAAGEYLAPEDRHRILNPAWFEDYSADFPHRGIHACTYIDGETVIRLPLGQVYVEVSKGFEIRPVRTVVEITSETRAVVIELEKVLRWREAGWVTADTHVHFLSPMTALLEGAGEGVNVVNLLASQWGELMTNVGDFDGRNTWGSRETGGNGEYLVRVGTENRQHVLGHISLLGYRGRAITPLTTGGPDESALGDGIDVLLTEWARQCRAQGGLVVLPHFPNPRAEHAASIVHGDIDALEMTSWGDLYSGIDPYSLADWYRYLNCGYLVAAVGGTDKMSASTAVGTVRTYARIPADAPFTYDHWMAAVRRGETFVTYGPLLDFAVDGKPMGSRIAMSARGGTVDVTWQAASVTVPMSRIELIVNGEIRESVAVAPWQAAGAWRVAMPCSGWLALLVRGQYADQPEMVAAHSSPVRVEVAGSPILAAADAVTILEQIEGALAYLDTVGTRADDLTYKRMRLVLEAAHRALHNRMHQAGHFHAHTPPADHAGHHG
jgi:hypothetical protein